MIQRSTYSLTSAKGNVQTASWRDKLPALCDGEVIFDALPSCLAKEAKCSKHKAASALRLE